MLLLALACAGDKRTKVDPTALVDMNAWEFDKASTDPMRSHRPSEVKCAEGGAWGEENGTLEVETGVCNYLSVSQPWRTDLQQGLPMTFTWWHTWLQAEEPGEAHVAVYIDGTAIFDHTIAIPSDPEVYEVSLPFVPGERVTLHVHNHGANSWNFLPIELDAPELPHSGQ